MIPVFLSVYTSCPFLDNITWSTDCFFCNSSVSISLSRLIKSATVHLQLREDSEPLSLIREDECMQHSFTVRSKDNTEMRDDKAKISVIFELKGSKI